MLISRKEAAKIVAAAQGELKNKNFNIQTQYKILKLIKAIEEEDSIMNQSVLKIAEKFAERDEDGNIIYNNDGGLKLDQTKQAEIIETLSNIENAEIQLPDIFFSLEELDGLGLTLAELDAFMTFIK